MKWVVVQAVLFALILLIPTGPSSSNPNWLEWLALVCSSLGFAILLKAIYDLRRSLAISPSPAENGRLQTSGIYGVVRHPMYIAVWLILGGGAVRSEGLVKIGIFIVIVVFFVVKTKHEEKMLKEKYRNYKNYTETVGGFFPKIG